MNQQLAPVTVAAAVIFRDGKYLIGRRENSGNCANLWEFPGGKLEPGETPAKCAVRECREELGVEIIPGELLWETEHKYPDRLIRLIFLRAELPSGEPARSVHRELAWVAPGEFPRYEFCPADGELIARLDLELRLTSGAVSVRPIRRTDGELLLRWMNDPEVLRYYEGRDHAFTEEQVRESFLEDCAESRHIVEYEGVPIGYIQIYRLDEEGFSAYEYPPVEGTVYGIDQFIGEPAYWNRGIGRTFLKMVLGELIGQRGAEAVILDPHADNTRAIRCYEACGFRKLKFLPAHELHEGKLRDCWLMEYRRGSGEDKRED